MRTIQSQLQEKGLVAPSKEKDKKESRPKEKLSQRDIRELMGMHTPTYRRGKGGAMRQQ